MIVIDIIADAYFIVLVFQRVLLTVFLFAGLDFQDSIENFIHKLGDLSKSNCIPSSLILDMCSFQYLKCFQYSRIAL